MEYGLIGEHLGHSYSKLIHERMGRYEYELTEVAKEDIDRFMTEHAFKAINVTIPYKKTVIPYLSEISDRAKAIGAVNTIVNRDGKLFGDNTDFGGMRALIRHMGLNMEGAKVLILGTGGTSLTARAVAKSLGAALVLRASRSAAEADSVTYEAALTKHADADFVINTTPCGMFPNNDTVAVDISRFPKLKGVVDVVYNPLATRLVREARALGIPAEGGLYMLVAQAILAAEIFLDEKLEESFYEDIFLELKREKEQEQEARL